MGSTANELELPNPNNREQDEFCNIIEQYGCTLPSHTVGTKINIRDAHSWDEVVRAAKDAEAAYLAESKKGTKGVVRGYLRRFGDYSAAATPWVGLLPNDKYFSVLCGSLKIVLGIAARRSERRIEIFEAFELLPATIEKTQRCHEIFPRSLELRDKALTVYLDILTMIEAMIACLMDKKLLHRIKDGLRGPLADEALDEKKRRFHISMEALEQQVQFLHLRSSAEANASIATMGPSLHNTEKVVLFISDTSQALDRSTKTVARAIDGLRSDVASQGRMTGVLVKEVGLQTRAIELQSQARNDLNSLLQDVMSNVEWHTIQLQRAWEAINRNVDPKGLQAQLESNLGHALNYVSQDLDLVLRTAQSNEASSQGAMYWVLQSGRFRHWLQSPFPDVLGINGGLEDGTTRYSSTSLLCGMLVQSIQERNATPILLFFCGSHGSKFEPLSGPTALIQSLVAQLLPLQRFDLSFLRFGKWEEGLRANIVSTYCRLFSRLIEQLPTTVIFCIIDSISIFEVEGWDDDLQLILRTILETIANEQLNARLKLLMTSAARSSCLDSLLCEDNKLQVPTDAGDQRLLTGRSAYSELADGRHDGRHSPMYERSTPSLGYTDIYETGYD